MPLEGHESDTASVQSSNLASNSSTARTSSRNSSAWRVCWMLIAKSCRLSAFFLIELTDPCLCSFETSQVKPTAHGKRHGTAKAQEAGKTSRHLQPVSAGWEFWRIDTFRATRWCCHLCGVLLACNSLQDSSNIERKPCQKMFSVQGCAHRLIPFHAVFEAQIKSYSRQLLLLTGEKVWI